MKIGSNVDAVMHSWPRHKLSPLDMVAPEGMDSPNV